MTAEKLSSELSDPAGSCASKTVAPVATISSIGSVYRISTMDCSAEESEIRRALEPFTEIRSLVFKLGARTLKIDATDAVMPLAIEAIRRAGFDPTLLPSSNSERVLEGPQEEPDYEHSLIGGAWRLVLALLFAVSAEILFYFAPETMPWKITGMAIAGIAIGLAGLDTYKKGLSALLRGKLNINTLMAVAVTGAFVIGQWPEAAMVMALYAIAELIGAKAVGRARDIAKGLLDITPALVPTLTADGS